ncbi:MAG: hypothetical protein A2Y07_06445 [Planctomycetes bacterium GWF2_50_10]|nr:MAG: hypothetical protein A2Y07_06445 [Planctomycetes bacterium GWF2_50_10]
MIFNSSPLAAEFWQRGYSDDCPIIDFHGHMNEIGCGYLPRCRPENMLKSMDAHNVKMLLFCSHTALMAPALATEMDKKVVEMYPDRFRAYYALNANTTDIKREFKHFQDNIHIYAGIKMLPDYFKRPINDPTYERFYDLCNDQKLLFLCHTWDNPPSIYNGPTQAEEFLKKYPAVTFIAGHSFHPNWKQACRLCNTYPNLYLELTAVLDERGPLEQLLASCGSQKLLFGTDLPWFNSLHGIGTILSTNMSDDDRKNIFFRNGNRILSKYLWFKDLTIHASKARLSSIC